MALLEVENLKFSYSDTPEKALNGVSFKMNDGELCLVIGKSGSGKSTLLRLLKKEIAPFGVQEGSIRLERENIGFVNQNVQSNMITDTVLGELAFTLENEGLNSSDISLKIAETTSYFNLNAVIHEKTDKLSGGMKQLLSLAAVMTAEPDVLVLDEPLSQLDPVSARHFVNAVLRLNRERGITVIISEHRIEELLTAADKVLVLDSGKSVFFGTQQQAANFLIESKSDLAEMLPPFTLVLKGNPIEYSKAKQLSESINIKNETVSARGEAALTARNISFAYKKGLPDIFFSLNYMAEKGKINAIIGANGSGKTTLLKCLSGILKCYSGKIKRNGKTVYMPQNVSTMFIRDTVLQEIPQQDIRIRFNIENLKNRSPFDLSGGEAQRAALAKIISLDADIILLDEPTQSADAVFKKEFAAMLRALCSEGKTVVLVTHDLEFAGRYADHISFLFNGEIAASAPRRAFFSKLSVYTTALSRLTGGKAVSIDDTEVQK